MRSLFGSRRWFPLLVVLLLVAGTACDDGVSAIGDGGTDTDTDSDTDVDTDTDTDTDPDSDAGPDGGGFVCEADPDRIFDDVAFLASEEMAGRLTGSPENELAMQMGEGVFAEIGLEPVGDDGTFEQAFEILNWSVAGDPAVTIDGDALNEGSEFEVFGYSGEAEITAEVVYVGYGMTVPAYDPADYPDCPLPSMGYDDYAGIDVTGKIALVVRHGPDDDDTVPAACPDDGFCDGAECLWNFWYKAANAELHGAAAMIVVQNYDNGPDLLADAALDEAAFIPDFPAVFVDRDPVEAAVADLETWTDGIDGTLAPDPHATGIDATISVDVNAVFVPTGNVIGAIVGTDPDIGDEVIVVGGHIDHLGVDGADIYYGADDNASGAAVTMELARLIKECANPARTIVFALWNGEEEGMLYPLESTIAAFSVDMVGVGDGSGIMLYGTTEAQNSWLLEVMQGSAAEMEYEWAAEPAVPIDDLGYGSDNLPFDEFGIPNAYVETLGDHLYYHTPADTIDTITVADLEAAAAMVYAGLKPLVEGTEDAYLSDGKGKTLPFDPKKMDRHERLVRDR